MERSAISSGPALMIPAGYPRDLPSALVHAARNFPEAGVVEVGPDGRPTRLDNPILLELAARILSGLRAHGIRPGDAAIVHCTEPIGFLASFWACSLGGIRPLLATPAAEGDTAGEGRERLRRIAAVLGNPVLIGRPSDLPADLGLLVLDPDALAGHEPATEFHRPAPDEVAVLMMSSGTSGTPKLIQLTHRGLVEFAAGTPAMLPIRPGQITLNWLPLDHSGAFLLYHLLPVFIGCTNIHASTAWVLADPLRWFDLMATHRVNHSWAPNFAYRLVTAAVQGDPDRHWDLSALRSLVSGGEQITVPVVAEFLRVTSRFGIVPETFVPAWGMTETVTGITFARPGLAANVHRVRIGSGGAVEWLDNRTPGTVTVAHRSGTTLPPPVSLVSAGAPAPGVTVRIVGANGRVLPEGWVGQLQVASARVTPGYLGDPAADRAAFPVGNWPARKWLATGDQAFITGGQVVLTGRDSDRIIINGHNHQAHDIEAAAATVNGLQAGLVAACGIPDPSTGTDRLVVFYAAETEPPAGTSDAVRAVVFERFALAAEVVPVPRHRFPVSTGGKVLRPVLKDRWLDGTLLADPDTTSQTASQASEAVAQPVAEAAAQSVAEPVAEAKAVPSADGIPAAASARAVAFEEPADPDEGDATVVLPRFNLLKHKPKSTPELKPKPTADPEATAKPEAIAEPSVEVELAPEAEPEPAAEPELTSPLSVSGRVMTRPLVEGVEQTPAVKPPADVEGGTGAERDTGVEAVPVIEELAGEEPVGDESVGDESVVEEAAGAESVAEEEVVAASASDEVEPGIEDEAEATHASESESFAESEISADEEPDAVAEFEADDEDESEKTTVLRAIAAEEPEAAAEAEPVAESESEAAAEAEPVAEPEAESAAEAESEAGAAAEVEPAAEPVAAAEVEPAAEPVAAAEVEPVDKPETEAETEAEAAGEVELVAEAEPVVQVERVAEIEESAEVEETEDRQGDQESAQAETESVQAEDEAAQAERESAQDESETVEDGLVVAESVEVASDVDDEVAQAAAAESEDETGEETEAAEAKAEIGSVEADEIPADDAAKHGDEAGVESAGVGSAQPVIQPIPVMAGAEPEASLNGTTHIPAAAEASGVEAGETVALVARVFGAVLGQDVDEKTPVHQLGADSVSMVQVHGRLQRELGFEFPRTAMFDHSSVLALGNYLHAQLTMDPVERAARPVAVDPIAIIGVAARLPGATTLDEFWQNLTTATNSTTVNETNAQADAAKDDESDAGAGGVLAEVDAFDAEFFGISAREAELTDPAQRHFLEVAQHALEHGGYAGAGTGRIGLFAGSGMTQPDFLATRVAYRLGLTGPAIGVQTAGSSSLVAVHLACQALRSGDTDLALAGAAAVQVPQATALHERTEEYGGTVAGHGVAAVLLKRLDKALADGDTIHAVIRGSAVNNEGAGAPALESRIEVIEQALQQAGLDADTLGYIEVDGIGVPDDDEVEYRALAEALGRRTDKTAFCTLGSVQPNIGYLDNAAGMAGLLKTVLMLQHHTLVPTLGNVPELGGPFRSTEDGEWTSSDGPLRAGVNAVGNDGSSAHVILEEPPVAVRRGTDGPVVLALSAAEPDALEELAGLVRDDLLADPERRLIDVAGTAALGRPALRYRLAVTGSSAKELAAALERPEQGELPRGGPGPLGFAFTGQGAARRGMAAGLATRFPVFRAALEECDAVYAEETGGSLLDLLLSSDGAESAWPTETAQPALFAFEVALAKLWRSFGVEPALVVGHSVGEYAALCVAGALSVADGVRITTRRGKLLQQGTAPGAMVAVRANADRVRELVQTPGVEIAAGNGPHSFVLTGAEVVVGQLAEKLDLLEDVAWQRIDVDRAFHSSLLDPILEDFAAVAADVTLLPLRTPMVSTWSGELLETDTVVDVDYLVGQLREPVLFGAAVEALTAAGCRRFLELGPDAVLSPAGRRIAPNSTWIPTQRLGQDPVLATMNALAELYRQGAEINWDKVFEASGRVPLPPYPFRKVKHRIDDSGRPGRPARTEVEAVAATRAARIELGSGVPGGFEPAPAPTDADAVAARYQAALEIILDLTAEQLGLDPLDITSDHTFLELGAESLSMLRVVQEVRQRFSAELEVRDLFSGLDTPHRLATAVAANPPAAPLPEATMPAEPARVAELQVLPEGVSEAQTALSVLGDGLAELVARVESAPIGPEGPAISTLMTEQLKVAASLVEQITGMMRDQLAVLGRTPSVPAATKAESLPVAPVVSRPVARQPAVQAPLTPGQRGIWFLEQLRPDRDAYHESKVIRLEGPLDVGRLRWAFERVVDRHAPLRTSFPVVEGLPLQQVHSGRVELPLIVAEGNDEDDAAWAVLDELSGSFDLAGGPLLRARLVRLADDKHLLVAQVHHLVFDSYSTQVLLQDLAAYYRGEELPVLTTTYPAYAASRSVDLARKAEDLGYWRETLSDLVPLRLPTDRPRPSHATVEGASLVHELDAGLREEVAAFSRQNRVTPFMTLLAAVGAVLGRFAGQQDLVIGTALSNRPAGTEELVGLFIEPVPLRMDLTGEPTLADLAVRVREATMEAVDHTGAGFDELVEALNPVRDPARNPIFQVLVEYGHTPDVAFDPPGLRATVVDVPADRAPLDLTLYLVQHADGIRCTAEYSTALYDEVTVRRLLEYVEAVLRRATSSGDTPLAVLTAPTAADRAVLDRWSGTQASDDSAGLHTLFEEQVARTPDAIALIDGERSLTYAELDQRANLLAWQLVDRGIEPDQLVAIRQDRGVELVVAVLAVLKAGAAYLPLDPGLPEARWAFMTGDAGAVALVGDDAALADRLGLRLIPANAAADDPRALKGPGVLADPIRIAYCAYTSGSTGRPKGVAVPHRGPVALIRHYQRERAALRTLQWTSFGFDVSVQELFSTLASGSALVLLPEESRFDPAAISAVINAAGVERLFMTYTPLTRFLASGPSLPGLREIVSVGEELVVTDDVRHFFASHPDCLLSNEYGPTEASIIATSQPVYGAEERPAIGRPIEGVLVRLLDERSRPVPVGAVGEIHLGGTSVARGYIGRPDETAAAFVTDPEQPGARLYRTRDLGRWRPDGSLQYLGRLDDQVKIRGNRVEPGETQHVLAELPQVLDAVVVVGNDPAGETCLIGYVVLAAGVSGPAEVIGELRKVLPEYLVPALLMPIDALPLTPGGKLDRAGLPLPAWDSPVEGDSSPRTELERGLQEIWSLELGVRQVPVDRSYFELGGNSMAAVRLIERLRAAGLQADVVQLFQAQTIRSLAAALDPSSAAQLNNPAPPVAASPPIQVIEIEVPAENASADNTPADNRPTSSAPNGKTKPAEVAPVAGERLASALAEIAPNGKIAPKKLNGKGNRSKPRAADVAESSAAEGHTAETATDETVAAAIVDAGPVVNGTVDGGSVDSETAANGTVAAEMVEAGSVAMGMVAAETIDGEMVDVEIDVAETVMAVSAEVQTAEAAPQTSGLDAAEGETAAANSDVAETAAGSAVEAAGNAKGADEAEAASDAPAADKAEAAEEAEAAGDVATVAEAEAANNAGVAGEFAVATGVGAAEAEAVAAGLPVADLVDEGEERVGDGVLIGALSDGHGIASVVVDSAPLSSTQTRLRELHAVGERPAVYNVAHRVVLSGDLDPAALEHALWMLVDRHPALRTRFVDRPGGAVQEVLDQVPVRLPVEDLGMATDGGESWSEALASEGLEPGEAPLWRAHLGRLADDRWVLVLVVHHLITDAWSTALIWSDLSSLYAEVLAGMPNSLGPSASYTEYTRWRLAETSTRRTELERFWHSELDGARLRLPLPYDRPRPERLSGNGATMRFDVPARTAALLDRVAEKLGSTRASVLTAAYAVWMSRLSGERDLVVALSSPSRVRPEHAKTVGPVGEALLVRLCLGTEIRFADLVAQVGTRVFKALDHHALGLAEVYRLVDPERPTESPQVLFTVDTTPQSRLELPGASAEIEPLEAPGTARTELYFVLAPSADGISGRFEYSTDLFDEKTVDGWRTAFLAVLDELSLSPGGII